MLKEKIEKIFKNYLNSRNEEFANHPIAAVLRRDLPKDLESLTENSNNYKFTGSAGQGNWTHSPWIAVFNKKITESAQKGYYIVYLFREDMKGVYLSLNQGMTDLRNQTSNNAETKEILRSRASDFRKQLKDELKDEYLENIDLGVKNSPNAPFYEAGNIYAKYYSSDDLPSEDVLEEDYKEILRLYNQLVGDENILKIIEDKQEIKESQDKFLEILYQNSDEIISTDKVKIGLAKEMEVKAYWSDALGFWVVHRENLDVGNRYFNGFGLEKPEADSKVSADVEINIEKSGINRKTAGAFAKDLEGNTYLIHRGSIGGKNKKDFFDEYHGETALVQDGNLETRVVVIAGMNDPKLPEKVRDFIFEVSRIKNPKLIIIHNEKEIEEAQERFVEILKSRSTKKVNAKAGFQGGQEAGEVYWTSDLGIWLMARKIEDSRYWNGFGIKEPSEGAGLTITAEINFPINGIDRRIAGAFVTDGEEIYVTHRGKLGGNYSKKFFDENYNGDWTTVQDGEQQSEVVLIGSLSDPKLPEKVSEFIFDVSRMKESFNINLSNKTWISDFLEKVFKSYLGVKTRGEPVKNHPLANIFLAFKNDLKNFSNNLRYKNSFNKCESFATYHGKGKWVDYPNVYIYNIDLRKQDKYDSYPYLVSYGFSNDLQKVQLSLRVNWYYPRLFIEDTIGEYTEELAKDYIKSITSEARTKLLNMETAPKNWLKPKNPFYRTIFYKTYSKNNLPSEEVLQADLIEILKLYQDLISEEAINPPFNSFNEFYTKEGFYFTPEIVENFLLSLKVKPFVILTGNSGTGKTKIAQLFAEYLETTTNSQHKLVPVGANWTENRHLLGFYNIITKNYQKTAALNLIMRAPDDGTSSYFLVLDEMNLSHVERYFADFLSAIESDESISLHSNKYDEIPLELDIPRNLLVIGTVNVDETTYMFSPKVLDRANTIEFSTYPAKDYMHSSHDNEAPQGNIKYLENPLSDLETRKFTVEDLKEHLKDVKINSNDYLWDVLADEIQAFQDVLGKAGFDFGFRVINEILRFMYVSWVYEGRKEIWDNWMRYFDAQIKQKMLPKLHGSQRVLEEVLRELFELCYWDAVDSAPRYFENLETDPAVKYQSSVLKLQEMDKVLNEQRYVSFIN